MPNLPMPDVVHTPLPLPAGRDERRERAYALWAFDPSHNVRRVANAVGVHHRTVSEWKRLEQWELRYAQDHAANLGRLQQYNAVRLQETHAEMIDILTSIARNPDVSPRDRILAAKSVAEQANPSRIEVTQETRSLSATVVKMLDKAEPDDAARVIKATIESNMQDADDWTSSLRRP